MGFIKNNFFSSDGFTLIELLAVISIISLMLFFSVPRLDRGSPFGDLNSVSRWLLLNVQSLKSKSMNEQKEYILNVSFEHNAFSVTDRLETGPDAESVPIKTYQLPQDVTITGVEFPEKGFVSSGTAHVFFYDKGYSDMALIHLRDEDGSVHSLLIEPFLPAAKVYEEYKSFS